MVYRCAGGLDHENVPSPDVLTDFNHYLAIAKSFYYCLSLKDLKVLANLGSQLRIGIATKKFESVQYHEQKPNNPHGA